MSALNFILQEDAVMVATDTLSLSGETYKPHHFQTKFFIVPHLLGVICGTGTGEFIAKWAITVQTSMLAKSIPHLDEFTTEGLRILYKELNIPENLTSTVYQFGYDYDSGKFRGFAYRSVNNFISEELGYGFGTKPPVPNFVPTDNPIEDFKKVIAIQREEDLARPQKKRIGIGGEIHILLLEPSRYTIVQVHRFDDYDTLYEQMCDELPANKQNT